MRQLELFDQKLKSLVTTAKDLITPHESACNELLPGNDLAACYAVASACKQALQRSGMSREQMVDEINIYWGRSEEGVTADPPECLSPLTASTFNNYLSKPAQYRIPVIYVIAIEAIAGNLEISRMLVEAQGGQVINGDEARQLKLAQVQQTMHALSRHEKELKKLAGY